MDNVIGKIGFATLYSTQVRVALPNGDKYDTILWKDKLCERFVKRIAWCDNPPSIFDSIIIVDDRRYNLKTVGYYEFDRQRSC